MWQNSKTKNAVKFKNSKWDKTKEVNSEEKLTTQNVTKLKKLNVAKIIMWQNWKTKNVTKLKNWKCEKTKILRKWLNSKTQNLTIFRRKMWQTLKTISEKKNKIKCDKIYDKAQKLKIWQNSDSKCDKTQKWEEEKEEKNYIVTKRRNKK